MRKSLLKTVVATAIVGAVMTVSSVVAMAAETREFKYYQINDSTGTHTINDGDYFAKSGSDNQNVANYLTVVPESIAGISGLNRALKLNKDGSLTFTTSSDITGASVTVYWSGKKDTTSDNKIDVCDTVEALPEGTGVYQTTVSGLKKDTAYTIKRNNKELALYYAVVTETIDPNAIIDTYTWKLGDYSTLGLEGTLVLTGDNKNATLTYTDGTDYTLNGAYSSFSITDEEAVLTNTVTNADSSKTYTYTVTPEISWFTAIVQEASGSHVHNVTDNGTDSDYYEFTQCNTSTSKGTANYNGLTLTKCIKMETNTNISFTAESAGTLKLVFASTETNKAVKIDNTENKTDDNAMVIVELDAGKHSITKSDGINLFYIVFSLNDATSTKISDILKPLSGDDYYAITADNAYIVHGVTSTANQLKLTKINNNAVTETDVIKAPVIETIYEKVRFGEDDEISITDEAYASKNYKGFFAFTVAVPDNADDFKNNELTWEAVTE